jgi:hypothetical protein
MVVVLSVVVTIVVKRVVPTPLPTCALRRGGRYALSVETKEETESIDE